MIHGRITSKSQSERREESEVAHPKRRLEAASEEQERDPRERDQQDHLVHQEENAERRTGKRSAPTAMPRVWTRRGRGEEEQDESELGEVSVPTGHELRRCDREYARRDSGARVSDSLCETCGSSAAARAFAIRLAAMTAVMK